MKFILHTPELEVIGVLAGLHQLPGDTKPLVIRILLPNPTRDVSQWETVLLRLRWHSQSIGDIELPRLLVTDDAAAARAAMNLCRVGAEHVSKSTK